MLPPAMHLSQALPDGAGQHFVAGQFLLVVVGAGAGQYGGVERAFQVGHGPVPRIAFVDDVGVGQRQRMGRLVALHAHDLA